MKYEAGFSLLEVLVATAIASAVAAGMSLVVTNSMNGARHVELRGDLDAIRMALRESLDCQATFEAAAVDPESAAQCGSTATNQNGPFLRLRRFTNDGSVRYLTGPLSADGSARIGSWDVRASCSATEKSLVVQAARARPGGGFQQDPLTKKPLAWNRKAGVMFAGDAGFIPICYGKGALTGEIVKARQAYDWQPGSHDFVVRPIESDKAGVVTTATTSGAGGATYHGLVCNRSLGWRAISCNANTIGVAVTSDVIRQAVTNPALKFIFDTDAYIDTALNGCFTNEVHDLRVADVTDPSAGIAIQVVCVKVGN